MRDDENSYLTLDPAASRPMDDLISHSITYRVAMGPRAGQKVFTLQTVPAEPPEEQKEAVAQAAGFSLHAGIGNRGRCPRLHQASHLPGRKAAWGLHTEFLEQLRGSDVRESFEAATHYRPDHRQRMECTCTTFGIDQLRSFWRLLRGHGGRNLRSRPRNGHKRGDVLRRQLGDLLLNHALQTAQVARFGFVGQRWTCLAGSPCARKTGNEGGEIRWVDCYAGKRFPIGECHQIRLNSAYLLQEFQRIQCTGHLAQLRGSGATA